jgi:hypothetical protein
MHISLPKIKGTPETEHISSELNKIELNNSTNSTLKNENINPTNSSEPQVNTINRSGTLTDDNDDIEINFGLSDDEDSLLDIAHMQENSLDACFNVGADEGLPARTDQSANQEENPVDSAPVVTQEENLITTKVEPNTEEVIVKVEPGTQSQVITAEFYRAFLKASTVSARTPINQRDEREFIRVLKEQFSKALRPYKTPSNT